LDGLLIIYCSIYLAPIEELILVVGDTKLYLVHLGAKMIEKNLKKLFYLPIMKNGIVYIEINCLEC